MENETKERQGNIQIFGKDIKLYEVGFWKSDAIMKIRDGYIPTDSFVGAILTIAGIAATVASITGFHTNIEAILRYYKESSFQVQLMRPALLIALGEILYFTVPDTIKYYRVSKTVSRSRNPDSGVISRIVKSDKEFSRFWVFSWKVKRKLD